MTTGPNAGDETICGYCGTTIQYDGLTEWIDDTGGDCCWGDQHGENDNEPHTPWRS